jgi:2-haloalkanoic acid dehalogenase type II
MTEPLQLSDFDALTFDFYGTIVDWEPEILSFLLKWTHGQGQSLPGDFLLEAYDRLRQPIQTERPAWRYPEVLRRTLDAMAQELGCALPSALRKEFGDIAATHQPFPDSVEALKELRARGLVLGALSNVDDASFEAILNRLGFAFDIMVTAQRVGAYKPDKVHFLAALSDLRARGVEKGRVLHVAQSKRADIVPATELGLSCVWVDRPGHIFGRQGSGAESALATYSVSSLAELLTF